MTPLTYTTSDHANIEHHHEVTEAEALERLCGGPAGCGIFDAASQERRCAGQRCMAWRRGRDLVEVGLVMFTDRYGYDVRGTNMDLVKEQGEQKFDPPVAVDSLKPEGEGWYITYPNPHSGKEMQWKRHHAPRGYCGWITVAGPVK